MTLYEIKGDEMEQINHEIGRLKAKAVDGNIDLEDVERLTNIIQDNAELVPYLEELDREKGENRQESTS